LYLFFANQPLLYSSFGDRTLGVELSSNFDKGVCRYDVVSN